MGQANIFNLLGIYFNTDLAKMMEQNYTPKIRALEHMLKNWELEMCPWDKDAPAFAKFV